MIARRESIGWPGAIRAALGLFRAALALAIALVAVAALAGVAAVVAIREGVAR